MTIFIVWALLSTCSNPDFSVVESAFSTVIKSANSEQLSGVWCDVMPHQRLPPIFWGT
ncbi:MAG: hypothetical protein PUP90_09055 [Nostoc sp. S4]|nr:hypothetical protein [Nostoc sp. S4]